MFDQIDSKEVVLPETKCVRDIESKVFQAIILKCLSKIKGIALSGSSLLNNLLGREGDSGIFVEQNEEKHSLYIKVEVDVGYGVSIPEKAEEIQTRIVEEISRFTGLHVSCVHVIFRNLLDEDEKRDAY